MLLNASSQMPMIWRKTSRMVTHADPDELLPTIGFLLGPSAQEHICSSVLKVYSTQ